MSRFRQSIHNISRRFQIETYGIRVGSYCVVQDRTPHTTIVIVISHINNQAILIAVSEKIILVNIDFFEFSGNPRQIQETYIYQIEPMLDFLPPAPFITPKGRDRKSTRLNSSHANISYA